jgi:hypothetical protein
MACDKQKKMAQIISECSQRILPSKPARAGEQTAKGGTRAEGSLSRLRVGGEAEL